MFMLESGLILHRLTGCALGRIESLVAALDMIQNYDLINLYYCRIIMLLLLCQVDQLPM